MNNIRVEMIDRRIEVNNYLDRYIIAQIKLFISSIIYVLLKPVLFDNMVQCRCRR